MMQSVELHRVQPGPVDDPTYNLLAALTAKLESIEAYRRYSADDGDTADLFAQMRRSDEEFVHRLLAELKRRLSGS